MVVCARNSLHLVMMDFCLNGIRMNKYCKLPRNGAGKLIHIDITTFTSQVHCYFSIRCTSYKHLDNLLDLFI